MPYFVGILRGIGDIFLPYCPQILFLLEVSFMGIFEPHKSPVQKGKKKKNNSLLPYNWGKLNQQIQSFNMPKVTSRIQNNNIPT